MSYNPQSWTQNILVQGGNVSADFLVNNYGYPAGYVPLNGSGDSTPTLAQLQTYAPIVFVSDSNVSGVDFTITGLDLQGNVVTEVLAGPNNASVSSVNSYWRITSIVPNVSNPLSGGTLVIGQAISTGVGNYNSLIANVPLNIVASAYASAASILIPKHSIISITSLADESSNVFTIAGIDVNSNAVTETLAGPTAGATVFSSIAYQEILSVKIQNAATAALELGTGAPTYTQWIPVDKNANQFGVGVGVYIVPSSVMTYTVQYAYISPVYNATLVQNDSILTAQTASGTTFINQEPFDAVRLSLSAYTNGQAILMVRPTGLASAGYPPIGI